MSRVLYQALLRLYPASFRAEYGPELARTFEDTSRGRGRFTASFAAIADVVPNAGYAHWSLLRQDLHFAWRTMFRSRGFVATVILVTALGVGANTATFSVADHVLFRPLPFPDARALVRLCEGPKVPAGWGCMNELSPANYRDVVAMTSAVRGWGAFTSLEANLVGMGEPVRVSGTAVSPEVLPGLGVRPMLGAFFDSADVKARTDGSVVLSFALWQSHFASDPKVIGRVIRLDDVPRVVVGVMPPGFHFPTRNERLWTPLVLRDDDFEDRNNTYLQAVGRLAPGASFEQARTELASVATRLAGEHPETNAETGFSFFKQHDQMSPRARLMLLALCGASLSLLLLTGATLANLLLVRASGRQRELAVRAALGAGRDRLIRQMLTESVVLALAGGVAGLVVAMLTVPLLVHLVPTTLPLADQPRLDLRVLGVAAAFTALTAIGFGLVPALVAGGRTGFEALRDGARGGGGRRQHLRKALVTVEVAVSVVLLVSAGFLIRAAWAVQRVDPGFRTEDVLTLRTTLSPARSNDTVRRVQFYDRVLADVRQLPGVQHVAYTSGLPMVLTGGIGGVEILGAETPRDRRASGVSIRWVTPQFFATMGIPVLKGRVVEESDRGGGALIAVVSQSFAAQFWPTPDPLGKAFRLRGRDYVVVGVVRDIRVRGLERPSEPQAYFAAAQAGPLGGLYVPKDLVIRTNLTADAVIPMVRAAISRIDPEQPVSDVRPLADVVEGQTADRRAQLRVLVALAGVALLLTWIGIHGLLAFVVAQRSTEIGVRLALGAEPGRVARMIVGEAARMALVGLVPGVIVAYAAARGMQSLLFGIPPGDPLTFSGGTLAVLVVTLIGSLVPAMRAVRVSPLVAMRAD